MRVRAWDTETRTFQLHGRKASPYHPGNWIVVQGWVDCEVDENFKPLTATEGPGGVPYPYTRPRRVYHGAERPPDGFLAKVLDGVDLLVGANVRFDLQHCLFSYPENRRIYREWVNRGGRIWDILHAEYVLRGAHTGVQWASLDSIAPKYGGRLKEDQVKAMWAQGIDTLDIPLPVLDPYLLGTHDPALPAHEYHPGDVGNTMLVFLGQASLKQRPSMQKVLQLDMLAIQCAAEMEMNGVYMDMELAEELRVDATAKLEEAEKAFLALIPEEHRPFVNPASRLFKSAVLYGGKVRYTRKAFLSVDGETSWTQWPEGQQAYPKKTVKEPLFNEDGTPLLFKSGRNAGQQKTRNVDVPDTDKPPKTRNLEVTFDLPRRVTPPESEEQGDDGAWSTSKKVLDQIAEKDESLSLLRELSLWAKDVATSYWVEDSQGNRKGLMTRVGDDGLIHPNFHTNTTATQRFSCDSPNLQQLSKKSRIKEAFKSRFGTEGLIAQGDFCLTPDTPVLTTDLRYVPVGEVKVGDELVGFDELPRGNGNASRKFRRSSVEGVKRLTKPCVRITLEDGTEFVCSTDHLWFGYRPARRGYSALGQGSAGGWISADRLKEGDMLSRVVPEFNELTDHRAYWMRGILDGEGYINSTGAVGVGQKDSDDNSIVRREIEATLASHGFSAKPEAIRKDGLLYYRFQSETPRPRMGWAALGMYRPVRLLAKWQRCWEGTSVRGKHNERLAITRIENIGNREVVAVQTSTRTFIARGFLTHNCSLESYSVALLTGDDNMLRDLNDPDFDMHCSAVAFFKGVTVPEAIKLCKGDDAVKEWKDLRQAMKGCNFAYEYGSGLKTLAITGDLTMEEAEKFVQFREQLYPTAVQFKKAMHQAVVRSIRYTGEMKRSSANPAYPFREGFGLWRAPTGRVWAFETDLSHPEQYKKGITETVAPTHTGNYPFQGTGCDWMKATMALAFLLECRGAWGDAKVISTVHDALYCDTPVHDKDRATRCLSYCLDKSNDVMAVLGLDMKARVPYTLGTGSSWADEHAASLDQYEPDFDPINAIFEYKQ